MIEKKPRVFSIGGDIRPSGDLTRFVKWPSAASKKPVCVKMGINHVTKLVEEKEAKLVVIAHDVDPIEIVMWLPSLCKARGIPYCIVKSKARLGALVGKKTATCLAITEVKSEHKADLDSLKQLCEAHFNSVY